MGQCFGGGNPNGPDRAAIARDQKIANQNKTDFDKGNRVIKLLLLGAGESGKSTIFKQISIINGKEPTKEELEENVPVVHMNIFNNIILLLEYAVEHGLEFGEMKQDVDEFLGKYDKNSQLTPEAVELIKSFWNSECMLSLTHSDRSQDSDVFLYFQGDRSRGHFVLTTKFLTRWNTSWKVLTASPVQDTCRPKQTTCTLAFGMSLLLTTG